MSNGQDAPTPAASTSQPGPDVLAERTLTGIFVHLIGLLTSFVGPLVVYAVSDHDFTRRNARNAMNWQLFYLATLLGALLLFGVVFLAEVLLPDLVVVALFLVVFALFTGVAVLGLLNVVFPLVATGKAIFGSPWRYPIAPDFLDLDLDRTAVDVRFDSRKPMAVFVATAPLLFGALLLAALGWEPDSAPEVAAFFATVLFVVVASLVTLALLYRDIVVVRRAKTAWNPNRLAYLGVPIGGGVGTYLAAALLLDSENPSGDAVYGYVAVLWLVVLVYLYRRRRTPGTP